MNQSLQVAESKSLDTICLCRPMQSFFQGQQYTITKQPRPTNQLIHIKISAHPTTPQHADPENSKKAIAELIPYSGIHVDSNDMLHVSPTVLEKDGGVWLQQHVCILALERPAQVEFEVVAAEEDG